jgi:hypothetical protein
MGLRDAWNAEREPRQSAIACWRSSAATARGHAATRHWLNSVTAVRKSLLGVERGAKMKRARRTSPKCRPPPPRGAPPPPPRTGANQGLSPAKRASQKHPLNAQSQHATALLLKIENRHDAALLLLLLLVCRRSVCITYVNRNGSSSAVTAW